MPWSAKSVGQARRFVRSALEECTPNVVDTAELLVDELVTNVVVHARTELELQVWTTEGRVHVQVGDERPGHGLVPHDPQPYASTGWGLALVEELASRHGVRVAEDRKTVWFELWPDAPAPPTSVWETIEPVGRTALVSLTDLPYSLSWASRQQRDALLREMLFAVSAGLPTGVSTQGLFVAQDTGNLINARIAAAGETGAAHTATLSLQLTMPEDAAPGVRTLRRVLEVADAASQQGNLLTQRTSWWSPNWCAVSRSAWTTPVCTSTSSTPPNASGAPCCPGCRTSPTWNWPPATALPAPTRRWAATGSTPSRCPGAPPRWSSGTWRGTTCRRRWP